MNVKIKDLPTGRIIWKKDNILGITGATLPKKYYKCYCKKIYGNELDYELVEEGVKQMTAKDMFEKLDFKLVNEVPLLYQSDDGGYIKNVEFINTFKQVRLSEWETYNNNEPQGGFQLESELLQAINKQVEELGWLKDENEKY